MKFLQISTFLLLASLGSPLDASAQYEGRHGWPIQKPAEQIIICEPGNTRAESMLLESLSGLAAQAVNEGKFNELVWINVKNESYKKIYSRTVDALNVSQIRRMDVWSLLDHLQKKKVIKGFILYKMDKTRGNPYSSYPDTDYSSNVATVYASLLKGVLIDESLLDVAKKHGLRQLKDARKESTEECFRRNKEKLNNASALSVPPTVTNLRDYAISQKLMLYADEKGLINEILEWVTPLSPILGWGCGDEYDFTSIIAEWGHYNTATNWSWNLPIISAVSEKVVLEKVQEISLNEIDFNAPGSFHSYVMSDGDNMQWTMGSFLDNPAYLGNDERDNVGLSWTLCPVNLSIVSPFTWNAIAEVQNPKFSYIEYGGGYQYPDLFAIKRSNRPELLREFAKRINHHMNELGVRIFGFICREVNSPEAREAYQIYAEEMENITGMLAVQYSPYELDGEIYWHKNKNGIEIPVVTAKYSIWDTSNEKRPHAGPPEYVSSLINRDALRSKSKQNNELSWTIVHAWSDFANTSKLTKNPTRGFNPVKVSEGLLIEDVNTVSTNEFLWRIRMKHRPEQTKSLMK